MESSYIKSPNAKRFVIEDSITKVTSDGEPHEMMTMIAGLSGILAAIVILTVLIFLVACKKSNSKHECDRCSESGSCSLSKAKRSSGTSDVLVVDDAQSNRSSTPTIYEKTPVHLETVSIIYNAKGKGNFQQNLNKAFEGSELNLQSALNKKPKSNIEKHAHWQDEMPVRRNDINNKNNKKTVTTIEIERY